MEGFLEGFKAEIVIEDDLKSLSVGYLYLISNWNGIESMVRYRGRGSAEKANWGIFCCMEKGCCFEPGRMFSFPILARVMGCWSDCKLHESRIYVLCISVWLIVSSSRLANVWNGQYSINIKWLGWSFVFLLPIRDWGSRIRSLIFSGLFFDPSSNLRFLPSLLVVSHLNSWIYPATDTNWMLVPKVTMVVVIYHHLGFQ